MYVLPHLRTSLRTNNPLVYKRFGATSFASVGISITRPVFWLADSGAIKRVSSDRHTFQKNVVAGEIINIDGGNIITVEGSDWKRHRSVAMSAFNEASRSLLLLNVPSYLSHLGTPRPILHSSGQKLSMCWTNGLNNLTLLVLTLPSICYNP